LEAFILADYDNLTL